MPDAWAIVDQLVELWAAIKQRWKKVTAPQWKYAIRSIKPCEFAVSDMVWQSGKNIRTMRLSNKLDHTFNGPYLFVKWICTQAYHFKLLQQVGSIHKVIHVLLLEPYVSNNSSAPESPAPLEVEDNQ